MTHLEQLNKLPSPTKEDAIKVITEHKGSDWLQKSTFTSLERVLEIGLPKITKKWLNIWCKAKFGEYDKEQNEQP